MTTARMRWPGLNRRSPLNRGLVAHWPMWEGPGSGTIGDLVNPDPKVLRAALAGGMDPKTAWVSGPRGMRALRFTAAKAEARLQNTAGINQALGSFVLSYTRRETAGNWSGLFGIDLVGGGGANRLRCFDSGSGGRGFSFYPNGDATLNRRWDFFPDVTSADINQFVLDRRYTVAATWDDTADELRGYLDGVPSGVEFGSGTWSPAGGWPGGEVLTIGNAVPGHASFNLQCAGDIDFIAFWDRVLSPSKVEAIHLDSLQGYPRTLNRPEPSIFPAAVAVGKTPWQQMIAGAA